LQTLFLDIGHSEPSSTTPTAAPSCANESPMDGSLTCACTKETFGCSIHPTTPGAWIASLAASHARILARLEQAKESTAIDLDFGPNSPACLAWFDPDSHSLRTAQCSLFEDSTACYLTLPRSGTMRNGRVYPRPMSALRTSGSESGYWPTPTKSDGTGGPGNSGRDGGQNLRTAVAQFPTPTARDWKSGKASEATMQKNSRPLSEQIGGSLNPTFVEWLMNWPLNFTKLKNML
jgi:hypothetical protein